MNRHSETPQAAESSCAPKARADFLGEAALVERRLNSSEWWKLATLFDQ
jgi:hypothetical protein